MTRTRSRLSTAAASLTGLVAAAVLLSGCSAIGDLTSSDEKSASASPSPSASATPYPSQFTRDGTFQSTSTSTGWTTSTRSTRPSRRRGRTVVPQGQQVLLVHLPGLRPQPEDPRPVREQAEGLPLADPGRLRHRDLRRREDPAPYELDAEAKTITFDPEPLSTKYGMLITSPKGAFELRNQKIKPTSKDTKGIDLHFTRDRVGPGLPGSTGFTKKVIKQKVPIAIFQSDKPTQAQRSLSTRTSGHHRKFVVRPAPDEPPAATTRRPCGRPAQGQEPDRTARSHAASARR